MNSVDQNTTAVPVFNPSAIPAELTALPQWVCWRYENRKGKPTKPPIQAKSNGKLLYAASDNPATWSDFATAVEAKTRLNLEGIGLNVWEDDGLAGIDLDKILSPVTGALDPLAAEAVARFSGTYAEISPSGTGIRIWCYGLPGRTGKITGTPKWLEVYAHPSHRYLTVTGNHWPGSATTVTNQQDALNWLHSRFMDKGKGKDDSTGQDARSRRKPRSPSPPVDSSFDDATLLEKARNAKNGALFDALWRGDLSGHGDDPSSADLALLNILAFWTDRDAARMDRLFRLSGLMRDKWDTVHDPATGRTYGAMSIDKSIADCREGYSGKKPAGADGGGGTRRDDGDPGVGDGDMPDWFGQGPDEAVTGEKEGVTRPNWKAALMRKRNSTELLKNHYNAVVVVENAYPGLVGYNEFRQRIEARLAAPWRKTPGQWTEADTGELAFHIAKEFASFTLDQLAAAVMTVAYRHLFNPAQERLRALADQWDGIPRLATWLIVYFGAAHNSTNEVYLREIGSAWIKGVAARVLLPGCKRDDVLILRSEQGYLKSTAANAIADAIHPDTFTDSLGNLDSKDAKAAIRGIIIAELGELSVLNKSDLESIKVYVATRTDHFREAYGRGERDYPRTVSFIGTTNHPTFLKDPTGNRRFWPVTLPAPINIARFVADLPQLLGEASRRVIAGEQWFVDDKTALAQAEAVRAAHFQDDVWTEAALNAAHLLLSTGGACGRCGGTGQRRDTSYPDDDGSPGQCFQCHGTGTLPGASAEFVTVAAILTAMGVRIEQQSVPNQTRIGGILRVGGWKEKQRRIGKRSDNKIVRVWYPLVVTPVDVVTPVVTPDRSSQMAAVTLVTPGNPSSMFLTKIGDEGKQDTGSDESGSGECDGGDHRNLPFYGNGSYRGYQGLPQGKQGIGEALPGGVTTPTGVTSGEQTDTHAPPVESDADDWGTF